MQEGRELTIRAIVLGIIGSVVITTSSMYVALKMGALPWPTVFVTIISMTVLKLFGNTNNREINIAHTTMSAGAMVAGGIAFTIPGIFIASPDAAMNVPKLIGVSVSGVVLGVVFTALMRKFFIEEEELPFPMGVAAKNTIEAGDEGGKKAKLLFLTMGLTAVFTAVRDTFKFIPQQISSGLLATKNIFIGLWISPMAVGIGYIIGPLYTGIWFLGAVFSFFLFIPITVGTGIFDLASADAFRSSLGIGLMVGTGFGVLIKGILPRLSGMVKSIFSADGIKYILPIGFAASTLILTSIAGLSLITSLLMIFGVWLATTMAASLTGQTAINPMEIFGIIVLLFIKALGLETGENLFLVAGTVAVAAGLCGDVFNDFKVGKIMGTKPRNQLIAESVGALIGAFISIGVMYVLFQTYGGFGAGTELIAPQASIVAAMVSGLPNVWAFVGGLIIGLILYLLKVPAMTLGIGVYLPMFISATVFLGGVISYFVGKFKSSKNEMGNIIASGLLGGEGITAVVIAIIKMITTS